MGNFTGRQTSRVEDVEKYKNEILEMNSKIHQLEEENHKLETELQREEASKKRKRSETFDDEELPHQKKSRVVVVDVGVSAEPEPYLTKFSITFSGFRNNIDYYTRTLKRDVIHVMNKLRLKNVELARDDSDMLDPEITHIIATPSARTMKVLQAVVSAKWVMSPEWILQLQYLPDFDNLTEDDFMRHLINTQSKFGFRCQDNFLKGRSVYLSETFRTTYEDSPTLKHCEELIDFAGAKIVTSVNNADFCLALSSQSPSKSPRQSMANAPETCHVCDWGSFIDLIYPPFYETMLLKCRTDLKELAEALIEDELEDGDIDSDINKPLNTSTTSNGSTNQILILEDSISDDDDNTEEHSGNGFIETEL